MFNRNMDVMNAITKSVPYFNTSGFIYDFTNIIGVPIVLPNGIERYKIGIGASCFYSFLKVYGDYQLAANSSSNLGSVDSNKGTMIHFGSNNTEPTKSDFNLKSPYNNGVNYKQLSAEIRSYVDKENDKVATTLTSFNQAITNLSIKELGLTTTNGENSNINNSIRILLSRDVLDTPLEVEAGKGFSLSISWEESLGLSKLGEITSVSGS